MFEDIENVRALIEAGSDPLARDINGKTPRELLQLDTNKKVAKYLAQAERCAKGAGGKTLCERFGIWRGAIRNVLNGRNNYMIV